ncbi:hypothetical protein SDC9_96152 [bioreactor metagenome]|uniref:Uncharacterized protein n=1 Tax=bioreactor metagenome TaxID=1076179 RepID=A0A645AF05_9ZZZZ
MRIVEAAACLGHGNRRVLAGQHQVVERALRAGEFAIRREGARDVAGIAIQFAARVDQHQLARLHRRLVRAIVQHAGVVARRDDGVIRHILRAAVAELMQQLGIEVVFAHILARPQHARRTLHGTHMRPRADDARAAHDVEFMPILHQPHVVQQQAQIALLGGAHRAKTHAGTHPVQPTFDLRGQALVRGERIPHALAVFQQTRHACRQLGNRIRRIHAQRRHGGLGAQAVAVPDFALQILGLAEQRARAIRRQHQAGVGLGEAGQIVEIAVMPIQKAVVAVALALGRRGDDGNAALAKLGGQAGASPGINRCG